LGDSTDNVAWLILGSLWLVTFFLYILMQCVSPLLPILINDFQLHYSMGGFLYSLPILMIALFSYPLGILSDRIGLERAVGCGAAVAILSSLIRPLSTNFYLLAFSTAVFGLGFAMCFPNLPKLVKENFPQHLTGTATGAYTTAIPLGSGLGIALTKPILTATGSWREALLIWSLLAIPVIVFWWIIARMSKKRRSQEPVQQGIPQLVNQRSSAGPPPSSTLTSQKRYTTFLPVNGNQATHLQGHTFISVLIAGLLLSLLNLIFYCTIGWLPTYLTERGWDPALAATATSSISFIEIPAVLLIPLLSDRIGRRRIIMISGFSMIAICSAIVSLSPSLSWFVSPVLGLTFGGIFALLLALPVELVEREKVGRAAGAIISIGYVGALIGPPITGYLRDLTGDFSVGFIVMAFVGLVAVGLSYILPDARHTKHRFSLP